MVTNDSISPVSSKSYRRYIQYAYTVSKENYIIFRSIFCFSENVLFRKHSPPKLTKIIAFRALWNCFKNELRIAPFTFPHSFRTENKWKPIKRGLMGFWIFELPEVIFQLLSPFVFWGKSTLNPMKRCSSSTHLFESLVGRGICSSEKGYFREILILSCITTISKHPVCRYSGIANIAFLNIFFLFFHILPHFLNFAKKVFFYICRPDTLENFSQYWRSHFPKPLTKNISLIQFFVRFYWEIYYVYFPIIHKFQDNTILYLLSRVLSSFELHNLKQLFTYELNVYWKFSSLE